MHIYEWFSLSRRKRFTRIYIIIMLWIRPCRYTEYNLISKPVGMGVWYIKYVLQFFDSSHTHTYNYIGILLVMIYAIHTPLASLMEFEYHYHNFSTEINCRLYYINIYCEHVVSILYPCDFDLQSMSVWFLFITKKYVPTIKT